MNSCRYPCESEAGEFIRQLLLSGGACACGMTPAASVSDNESRIYSGWLESGRNAGMEYMERNMELREDPRKLHEGTRTVISAAYNYRPAAHSPYFADYALGADYHYVLRERLDKAAAELCARFGGTYRVVVDSAPMRERYWAVRSGIGFIADNGFLCVPGYGMAVLVGFILWTGELAAVSVPDKGECRHCGRCRAACPGGAIDEYGQIDARRCLSYLTIEHRGEFAGGIPPMSKVYGCDICRRVCPLDTGPATDIAEFRPADGLMALTPSDMVSMTAGQFRRLFSGSAVFRLRVQGLRRNAQMYCRQKDSDVK